MTRKLLAAFLALCMLTTLTPFAFAANDDTGLNTNEDQIGAGGGTSQNDTASNNNDEGTSSQTISVGDEAALKKAIEDTAENDTITLTTDITLTAVLTIDRSVTIDLGGNTLAASANSTVRLSNDGCYTGMIVNGSANVTIKNGTLTSSYTTYKDGTTNASYSSYVLLVDDTAALALEKVNVVGQDAGENYVRASGAIVYDSTGSLTLTDCTASAGANNGKKYNYNSPNAIVTVSGSAGVVSIVDTEISGCTGTNASASWMNDASDAISLNGAVEMSISGNSIVTGGSSDKTGGKAVNLNSSAKFTVSGATLNGGISTGGIGGTAILVRNSKATLEIKDNANIIGGNGAVSWAGGGIICNTAATVTVTNSIVKSGTGTPTSSVATIVLKDDYYSKSYLTLDGATLYGMGGNAVIKSGEDNIVQLANTVTIAEGELKDIELVPVEGKDFTLVADGGTLGSNITVPEGYFQDGQTLIAPLNEETARAKIGEVYYATLSGAVEAAQSGDTITLLKDYEDPAPDGWDGTLNGDYTIYDLTGITLDLNGKTYSAKNFSHVFLGTGGVIKNGKMVCVNNGSYALFIGDDYETKGFTVDGVEMSGGINIYNATDVTLKNVTVRGTDYYAVWLDYDASVIIESGYYTEGSNGLIAVEQDSESTLSISGGYFTTDPSAYLAGGKGLVETDIQTYPYKVGDKATDVDTAVKAGEPAVTVPEGIDLTADEVKAAASAAETKESLTTAVAAAGLTNDSSVVGTDKAARDALETAKVSIEDSTPITIVIQPYLDVEVKTADTTTLTLDITAKYNVIATTNPETIITEPADGQTKNATIINSGVMKVTQPIQMSIALPENFANNGGKVYVQHKGYEYEANVNNNVATFTNPHGFSTFTVTAAPTAVATIGTTSYTSLQAAVDAVQNDETIAVTGNGLSAIVSGNKTFKVSGNDVTLTAASGYNLTKNADGSYTVSRQSSGGSGGSSVTNYNVTVNAATNGTVTADKKTAAKGTTVTITATPSTGYVVDSVKVVDKDGKTVDVTAKDGKYSFVMPASAVTVTATFKTETPAPSGLPFVDVKSGDWFYDAVKYAYENGLMNGTSETIFAPNGTMNRAMIVTVLYRLEKTPAVTTASQFADVPAGQWYSDAVAWAAANNIVNGYNETTFGPMNAVTREQMAAILYRYEQYKGMDTVTLEENLARFPDKDKVSAYAVPAMQWAVGQKVINGNADGTLNPTGTATRAQVAQIFTNLLNK